MADTQLDTEGLEGLPVIITGGDWVVYEGQPTSGEYRGRWVRVFRWKGQAPQEPGMGDSGRKVAWASLLSSGKDASGNSIWIEEGTPHRLSELFSARVTPNSVGLAHVTHSLLAFLTTVLGADHPYPIRLDPLDIGVVGKGSLEKRRIFFSRLCCLRADHWDEADTAIRLGRMIYQLASGKILDADAYQIPDTLEWAHLGKESRSWVQRINLLLGFHPPGLSKLLGEMESGFSRKGGGNNFLLPGLVAIILVAAALFFVFRGTVETGEEAGDVPIEEIWHAYRLQWDEWLAAFAADYGSGEPFILPNPKE